MSQYIPARTRAWLQNLPAGEYTLKQLSKITGKEKSNLWRLFKRLGVNKKQGQPISGNLVEVLYIWEGLQ
jgi:hypothetical protein